MVALTQRHERLSPEGLRRVHAWPLWKHRYDALDKMIQTLQAQVDGNKGVDRNQTFAVLLAKLRAFGGLQFDFLRMGLDPEGPGGPCLEASLEYPEDFVLEATLNQVGFDLLVFQGAWYQRVLAQQNAAMRQTLALADKLAHDALQPAVRQRILPFPDGQVTVLTYFQKAPHIRFIPYASIALVGIPYTTLGEYDQRTSVEEGNARDLLAIPHEIGHYVYRHGSLDNSRIQNGLRRKLRGHPDWINNWAEEIFADVYGVLVGGPVMVRDFQDIMRDNDLLSLLESDERHPTPVLRPLLYVDVLNMLAEKPGAKQEHRAALQAIAAEAEAQWREYRGGHGQERIDERRHILKEVIRAIVDILTNGSEVTFDGMWSRPEGHYAELYRMFLNELVEREGDLLAALRPVASEGRSSPVDGGAGALETPGHYQPVPELDNGWESPLSTIPTLRWLETIRNSLKAGCSDKQARIPSEVWTLVVSMNGWATNGPESNPSPKVT